MRWTPAALADLAEAVAWYHRRSPALESAFIQAVGKAQALIERHPEAWALSHRNVRRCLLRRFPYALLYILLRDEIRIVGCLHLRRGLRAWRRRG